MSTPLPALDSVPVGHPITIRGWATSVQQFKKHSFIRLRDGVGAAHTIQVFLPHSVAPGPSVEAYLEITGIKKALPPKAYSHRAYEFEATQIKILSDSDPSYVTRCPPDAGPAVCLDERHLYLRDLQFALVTKVRAIFLRAIREHFESVGATEVVPPCFVGVKCEGGASMFSLKHPAADKGEVDCYLTESSQFALEMAVPALGDTYCIYPSFRAERSQTRRHLTEFLHAECEWSGVITFEDHVAKLKELLIGILTTFFRLCEQSGDLLKELGVKERVDHLVKMAHDIMILTHADAIAYCRKHEIYKDPEQKIHFGDRDDIPEAQERQMIDAIGRIVFLCMFPIEQKSST